MEINIYIANLGKYNEGELVGEWVSLPVDEDELDDVYVRIKLGYRDEDGDYHHGFEEDGSFYEEMAIHDYEAPFKIHEYENIQKLNNIAEELSILDEEEAKIALALVDNGIESDFEDAIYRATRMEDIRTHHGEDMAEIAQSFHEEVGDIDKDNYLSNYIDWNRVGRDMAIDGTFIHIDDNLWIEVCY